MSELKNYENVSDWNEREIKRVSLFSQRFRDFFFVAADSNFRNFKLFTQMHMVHY